MHYVITVGRKIVKNNIFIIFNIFYINIIVLFLKVLIHDLSHILIQ